VRIYNVGFGDASLLTWDEAQEKKNIMIDFGNAPAIKDEPYYTATLNDIKKITEGKIDLLVCSHQHLDHYGGLYSKIKEFRKFKIKEILMPYIEPASKKKIRTVHEFVHNLLNSKFGSDNIFKQHFITRDELVSENPLEGDKKWDAIANLVKNENIHFFHRRSEGLGKLMRNMGFRNLKLEVLGPEEETNVYLSAAEKWVKNLISFFQVSAEGHDKTLSATDINLKDGIALPIKEIEKLKPEHFKEFIKKNGDISEYAERIVNNTSLVIRFIYSSKNKNVSLLFPGDAQFESWQKVIEASKRNNQPITSQFLKVSHHGSHNGTSNSIAKNIFTKDKKYNTAIISTLSGVYGTANEVPSPKVLQILKKYATVYSTENKKAGEPILTIY
jgi:beta-lactamase superfamily II metal-dependent hydrolase